MAAIGAARTHEVRPSLSIGVDMRAARAIGGMGLAFVLVMPLAVWLARPFQAARPSELPQDPTDPVSAASIALGALLFVALAAAMAAFVIWAVRTGRHRIIQGMVLAAVAVALLVVLARPALWLVPYLGTDLPWLLALAAATAIAVLLGIRPSWGLLNATSFLVAAGVAALTGAILGVTPLLVLLAFVAVYDHIAVHRTGHMQKLARAATQLRLPVAMNFGAPPRERPLFRRPLAGRPGAEAPGTAGTPGAGLPAPPPVDRPSSRRRDAASGTPPRRRPERHGILMGIGDLVFPTALVVAAADPVRDWGWAPAGVAGAGILVAYVFLVRQALKGEAQPGLPYLNAGAILGFMAGLGAATGSFVFW